MRLLAIMIVAMLQTFSFKACHTNAFMSKSKVVLSPSSCSKNLSKCFSTTNTSAGNASMEDEKSSSDNRENEYDGFSPWHIENSSRPTKKRLGSSRFRQHVNPLARKFQMPTDMISEEWPNDTFDDPTLPLHIDIGCGKGGFLLSLAKESISEEGEDHEKRNYLGLEIRPSVSKYAKERISKRKLNGIIDFIGCNANVDLDRLLDRYTSNGGEVALVSIQFPDPHFKNSHKKRRVVTPELVQTLAKYLPYEREVFIQSDIKEVLDIMRLTIREEGANYFTDMIENVDQYLDENPTNVPTEREVSVLDQNLPVYRTLFRRTDAKIN